MGRLSALLNRKSPAVDDVAGAPEGADAGADDSANGEAQDPAARGRRARQANAERPQGGRLTRLIHKVAGIVFPTNKSGNNMSVR
jgi:hypothetical protein